MEIPDLTSSIRAQYSSSVEPSIPLKCLRCNTELTLDPTVGAVCRCGAGYPLVGGILRFVSDDAYYWGEVGREEARKLLDTALLGSWREAVRQCFGTGQMTTSILDLQRAAWLPLLGLDQNAVGLDIGSGYGAITHALACSIGSVVSVEAITQRVEFTRERLRQEGITNVRLLQASATALPLGDNCCDLAVVNGVLEWVGEWDLKDDARTAQLRFLSGVARILKKDGVLVIGIENRFGYGCFLGARDHSGLRYTSVMPRICATWRLRGTRGTHYRTTLNARREYRTYTYSAHGLRKLIEEAGFEETSFYWADPGYNLPRTLVPLDSPKLVQEHLQENLDHPWEGKRTSLRRILKRASRKVFPWFVPDFVVIARKNKSSKSVSMWIREHLPATGDSKQRAPLEQKDDVNVALYTHSFSSKVVLRLRDQRSLQERMVAKVYLRAGDSKSERREFDNQSVISDYLERSPDLLVSVPRPIACFREGSSLYTIEAPADGTQFSQILRKSDYFKDLSQVRKDLSKIVNASIALTQAMNQCTGFKPLDQSCYLMPSDLGWSAQYYHRIEKLRYFSTAAGQSRPSWTQHGDLSVENVYLNRETGQVSVIDWTDARTGFPPLFDIFLLVTSYAYPGSQRQRASLGSMEEFWTQAIQQLFFSNKGVGGVVGDVVLAACDRLNIAPGLMLSLMVEFTIVLTNLYRARSSRMESVAQAHLDMLVSRTSAPIFGQIPVSPAT